MPTTRKLNLYKEHASEYRATRKPALVTIKPAAYLSIRGAGMPGDEQFRAQVGALYGVAYTVKMASKSAGRDYKVCGLEGLWWAGRKGQGLSLPLPSRWNWKLLIRTPGFITQKHLRTAMAALQEKGKNGSVSAVRLERIREGRCVQALHVGPYDREHETIAAMMAFAGQKGYRFHGVHHEIYLSDPRRAAPERLRTILRHPVRRKR
jgi:hypothetical protein